MVGGYALRYAPDRPAVELVTTLGPREIDVLHSSRTVSLRGAKWLW